MANYIIPDHDLINEIQQTKKDFENKINGKLQVYHIQSHQDDTKEYHKLTREAQ